jgi:eukaryotic-like serine/threonine-protein kinase
VQQDQLLLPNGSTIRDPSGDRYIIEGLLGRGGFGAVYLVRDRRFKQNLFALKELIDPSTRDRERFIFEGEILKRLDHRALPRVYRVFEHDKLRRVYLLMDYVKGRNLETLRKEQPEQRFALPLVLVLLAPIVDALIYLHHQAPPIVHRDIKPANIIVPVGADEAVLVDFGSAKEYVADSTTTAIRHGSPGYAALEQYGSGTTPRTDIYGLGATLYTLLTGAIPPDAISRATGSKGGDPLELAPLIMPEVPIGVAQAIGRAMSISTDERFATVEEFWQLLNDQATHQQVHIPRVTSADTPLPVPAPELDPIIGASLHSQRQTPRAKIRVVLLPMLFAVFLAVAIGMSSLYALVWPGHPSSIQSISRSTASTPTVSPVPTPTSEPSIYPSIVVSYAGTIGDLLAKEKTALFLYQIQQNQGNIQGLFRGLGLAGHFKGTVTPGGTLLFTVTIFEGKATLSFEGTIKVGGDIQGSYAVLDQNGHTTGEFGIWNVKPGV